MLRLASLALAAGLAAQAPVVRIVDDVIALTPASLDGKELAITRVIDAITGKPIAGAELLAVPERMTPLPGEVWWSLRATADADGFVRLPLDDAARQGLFVVRAPGFGTITCSGLPDDVLLLPRAQDLTIVVLDWRDRPVAGALVGFCGGCGHTPDLVHAKSDANGLVVLPGIDPRNHIHDLYVQHPELHITYDSVEWFPGDPPVLLRCEPAEAVRGTVVDAKGRPVAGAFVGTREIHRGPWAKTAADGTFALLGASRNESELTVVHGDREVVFPRPIAPCPLPLPEPSEDKHQQYPKDSEPLGVLRVQCHDDAGASLEVVEVLCRRRAPLAWKHAKSLYEEKIELPAGEYDVQATPNDDFEPARGQATVVAGKERAIELTARRRPRVRFRVTGAPESIDIALLTATSRREIDDLIAAEQPVPVPCDEPFVIELEQGNACRVIEGTRESIQELRWHAPTAVSGSAVDPDGQPAPVRAWLATRDDVLRNPEVLAAPAAGIPAAARFALTAGEEMAPGLAFLCLRPERQELQPLLLPVTLPQRGPDARVELGTMLLSREPRLRVLDARGQRYPGEVKLARAGWTSSEHAGCPFALDAQGGWLGPWPLASDALVLSRIDDDRPEAEELSLPWRVVLEGDGPWVVREPDTTIDLHVRDEAGTPVRAVAFAGEHVRELEGHLRLLHLPPGPHRLLIGAEGCKSAIADVTLAEGKAAEVRVALPRR